MSAQATNDASVSSPNNAGSILGWAITPADGTVAPHRSN